MTDTTKTDAPIGTLYDMPNFIRHGSRDLLASVQQVIREAYYRGVADGRADLAAPADESAEEWALELAGYIESQPKMPQENLLDRVNTRSKEWQLNSIIRRILASRPSVSKEDVRGSVYAFIRDDAPLGMKLIFTNDLVDKLIDRIAGRMG